MELIFEPFRKFATFTGRARRKEYWLFSLFVGLVTGVLLLLANPIGDWGNPDVDPATLGFANEAVAGVLAVFLLLALLPSLAVTIRRLHDSNRSGWWWFITLVPAVGSLVLFIFTLLDGTAGPNRFGPDPKGRSGSSG